MRKKHLVFNLINMLVIATHVNCIQIDNQLVSAQHDCFERIALGAMLPFDKTFRNSDTNSLKVCKELCLNDRECLTFAFGISARGNGTCQLSAKVIDSTGSSPIGTIFDPDFDLYARKTSNCLVDPGPTKGTQIPTPGGFNQNSGNTNNSNYNGNNHLPPSRPTASSFPPTDQTGRPVSSVFIPQSTSGTFSTDNDGTTPGDISTTSLLESSFPETSPNGRPTISSVDDIYTVKITYPTTYPSTITETSDQPSDVHIPNYNTPGPADTIRPTQNNRPIQDGFKQNHHLPLPQHSYPIGPDPFPGYFPHTHPHYHYHIDDYTNQKDSHFPGSYAPYYNNAPPLHPDRYFPGHSHTNHYGSASLYPTGRYPDSDINLGYAGYNGKRKNGYQVNENIPDIPMTRPCFRRVLAGKRVATHWVRRKLICERLEDCQRECGDEKRFSCEGFNYRLDPNGRAQGECELVEVPLAQMDLYSSPHNRDSNLIPHPDYDYYERDRTSSNCRATTCVDCGSNPGYLKPTTFRPPPSGYAPDRDRYRPEITSVDRYRPENNFYEMRPDSWDRYGGATYFAGGGEQHMYRPSSGSYGPEPRPPYSENVDRYGVEEPPSDYFPHRPLNPSSSVSGNGYINTVDFNQGPQKPLIDRPQLSPPRPISTDNDYNRPVVPLKPSTDYDRPDPPYRPSHVKPDETPSSGYGSSVNHHEQPIQSPPPRPGLGYPSEHSHRPSTGYQDRDPPRPISTGYLDRDPPRPISNGFLDRDPPRPISSGYLDRDSPRPVSNGYLDRDHPRPVSSGYLDRDPPRPVSSGYLDRDPPRPVSNGYSDRDSPHPISTSYLDRDPSYQKVDFHPTNFHQKPSSGFVPYLIDQGHQYGSGGNYGSVSYRPQADYWGLKNEIKRKDGPPHFNYFELGSMEENGVRRYGNAAYGPQPHLPQPIPERMDWANMWTRRPGVEECSAKTSEGFRLHKGVVRNAMTVSDIRDCERMCYSEDKFRCSVFSFRYSEPSRDNCLLCDRSFSLLDPYADIVPDRSYDIYAMSDDVTVCKKEPRIGDRGAGNTECFIRTIDGQRFYQAIVRDSLTVRSIGECEMECIKASKFTCRSFTFRYGAKASGTIIDNCQLSDWPVRDMDKDRHLIHDKGFDVFERASYGQGCEVAPREEDQNQKNPKLCYLGYGSAAKLLSAAIKKVISVSSELECKNECIRYRDSSPFKCLSFSYGSQASSFNCEMSDLDQSQLQLNVHYSHVTDRDYWLFAWNPFDYTCRDKITSISGNRINSDRRMDIFREPDGSTFLGHFTVSGKACRAGTKCEKNHIAGFYSCELESGEIGSWDFCCRADFPCGFSRDFDYPWCYVGVEREQWRSCSVSYTPIHTIQQNQGAYSTNRYVHTKYPIKKHDFFQSPPRPGGLSRNIPEAAFESQLLPIQYLYHNGPPNSTELSNNVIDCSREKC